MSKPELWYFALYQTVEKLASVKKCQGTAQLVEKVASPLFCQAANILTALKCC